MRSHHHRLPLWPILCLTFAGMTALGAEDWPEWRGSGRLGVWNDTGLLDTFPEGGLKPVWRTPVHAGYAGPAVAAGRVFVTDAHRPTGRKVIERVLALDENTGAVLWTREWETDYSGLETTFALGPRATPTVDGNRVYVVGAMGDLPGARRGEGRRRVAEGLRRGLQRIDTVVGHDGCPARGRRPPHHTRGRRSGREGDGLRQAHGQGGLASALGRLRAGLQPTHHRRGRGARQLLIWHPLAVTSLDPKTGRPYWEIPFLVDLGITVPTLVHSGPYLFVTTFYNGARMFKLDREKPAATLLWRGDSQSSHSIISTPVIQGDYIYGMSQGQLQCWELATGKQVWRTRELIPGRTTPFATAFFVRNGDRYFINTERGDLVIARLAPDGYHELSRTALIEPTHPYAREPQGVVHWSHPAYANKHVVIRNDREILRASLAKN